MTDRQRYPKKPCQVHFFCPHFLVKTPKIEIVRLIVLLARALSLETCAEGVETEEERAFLEGLSVTCFQGYLASPPLPYESFLSRMESSAPSLSGAGFPSKNRS